MSGSMIRLHRLVVQVGILPTFDPVGMPTGSIRQPGDWGILLRHYRGVFIR